MDGDGAGVTRDVACLLLEMSESALLTPTTS
jgi:hypothetical protein